MKTKRTMTAEEFDKAFDDGEDISDMVDWSAVKRPGLEQRRVNIDFPNWVVDALDREARRLGVSRQAVVKVWITERLDRTSAEEPGRAR